ncbi:hypothetical protein X961_5785 [Burkholderia pseudomallei MSHR5613]|nr:hypothetical protein X948_5506 [Burkholderia pseudomallei MSHR5608]KGS39239.1 hypothetical protein X961_5785 [Burkholderia pseudomallei MSHR5613]KGX05142.1 hypothetical protein Y601_5935 [Burkholderia pseudomallei MSHR640]
MLSAPFAFARRAFRLPTRFRHASPPFFPIDSPVRSRVWTGAGGDAFNDSPIC